MEFQQRIGQIVAIQMRVNLRSGDTLMPQHFLHRAQICPRFHQMRGETMSESVRRYIFPHPRLQRQGLDD